MTLESGAKAGIAIAGLIATGICLYVLYRRIVSPPPPPSANDGYHNKTVVTASRGSLAAELAAADAAAGVTSKHQLHNDDDKNLSYSNNDDIEQPLHEETAMMANEETSDQRQDMTAVEGFDEKNLHRQLSNVSVPNDDDLGHIFDLIDKNNDDILTLPEVEAAMIQRKSPLLDVKPAVLIRAFHRADADGDGRLGRFEFGQFLKFLAYYANLQRVFDAYDTEGDRRLDHTEFLKAAVALNIQNADHVFDLLSKNTNGHVVFDEFCLWMAEKRHDDEQDALMEAALGGE